MCSWTSLRASRSSPSRQVFQFWSGHHGASIALRLGWRDPVPRAALGWCQDISLEQHSLSGPLEPLRLSLPCPLLLPSEAVIFGDGGLGTLGANILVMGIAGVLSSSLVINLMKNTKTGTSDYIVPGIGAGLFQLSLLLFLAALFYGSQETRN